MDNSNPDLINIFGHCFLLIFLVASTFILGKRYGYNKRYHEVKKETKFHQWLLISFLIGSLAGYFFSYYMLSKTVSFRVEEAYELGYQFGKQQIEE